MTIEPLEEVIAHYERRRSTLLEEARRDDRARRPVTAAIKRERARRLLQAELAEEMNPKPDFWSERQR